MGDELNDWKRQASVSIQVWNLLQNYEIEFLPRFFTLFFLRKLLTKWNELQWRKYERRAQETKVKREAFDNINFPSCFYQIKRIILLNVLSSSSHPLWASFQTDFLFFFYMFGTGLYSSSCKFPLNFELLFSTAFFCVFVSVWSLLVTIQQSYKYERKWMNTIEETNENVEEKKVKNKSNPQMKVWWFWKSDMRCLI